MNQVMMKSQQLVSQHVMQIGKARLEKRRHGRHIIMVKQKLKQGCELEVVLTPNNLLCDTDGQRNQLKNQPNVYRVFRSITSGT
jgi:hypothetical protein